MPEKKQETLNREEIEKAIFLITEKFKNADGLTKPVLFHSIHVGIYLYDHGYRVEIVLAGFMHDLLEDTDTTIDEITNIFGKEVADFVLANTKDDSIADKKERKRKMVANCIEAGQDALIIKAADTLENYTYHPTIEWQAGVDYLNDVSGMILEMKPADFDDAIFTTLNAVYTKNK